MELSEKQRAKIALDIVECNARFFGIWLRSAEENVAVVGVGNVSNSTSSCAAAVRGSVSSDRSLRSWYRLRRRYFRAARNMPALRHV